MSVPVLDRPWLPAEAGPPRVLVAATDAGVRIDVLTRLLAAGPDAVSVTEAGTGPDTVVVAAGHTVAQALAACPARLESARLVVMADVFSREAVLAALRAGTDALLRRSVTTPERLLAALHGVLAGGGRLPHEVLMQLVAGPRDADQHVAQVVQPSRLTARQVSVLRLMADGLGNADIGRVLSCSVHTVKNVVYELTARLQARNRAHAVATAVRLGLI
jgi:DNA-binding NarL/FixJ family response regulator